MKKSIISKKIYVILLIMSSWILMAAHEPAEMKVKYSAITGILGITLYHKVNSTSVHFIDRIEISLNRQGMELEDKMIITQEFFSQPIRNEQRAQYIVNDLHPGDVLTITSYCNLFGELIKKLTISDANWQELSEP